MKTQVRPGATRARCVAAMLVGSASTVFAGNTTSGPYAFVGGGDQNTAAGGGYATVGGGLQNSAKGPFDMFLSTTPYAFSFIGGGTNNSVWDSYGVIAGGIGNMAGYAASIGGGSSNAADAAATIGGGTNNYAVGYGAAIPGGSFNKANAEYSFAAGYGARVRGNPESANDSGSFVWSDMTANPPTTYYSSSGPNQFLVRANGGFALNGTPVNANVAMTIQAPSGNPGYASVFLHQANSPDGVLLSSGDATTSGFYDLNNAAFYIDQYNGTSQARRLTIKQNGDLVVAAQAYKPGGGAWAASSDARLKTNIQPLHGALDRLLQLRGVTFDYAHPDAGMHPAGTVTGFVAQEVAPVFPAWIGHDGEGYLTVGPQGFEALTVEALRELKDRNQACATTSATNDERLSRLETENAALQEQLRAMQRQLTELTAARTAESLALH